jgi:hypothetical protein
MAMGAGVLMMKVWRELGPRMRRRGIILCIAAGLLGLAAQPAPARIIQQPSFTSPESAVAALVAAARANRTSELVRLLGPDGKKLVTSGDPIADQIGRAKFAVAYQKHHEIKRTGDATATLIVGDEQWPLPIPVVRDGLGRWHFNTKAGAEEVLARRIGRNELGAIEVCRAYADAQREYASTDRDGDGLLAYAQRFTSSKGRHDGLYWPVKPGEPESPVGALVASAHAEGYKRQPYHGYYYKILKGQGKDAPGGAYSYMAKGRMIGGFALVAFPAEYGNSGIMTFLISHEGVVYQKNLGPKTASIARAMTAFNPDPSWKTP